MKDLPNNFHNYPGLPLLQNTKFRKLVLTRAKLLDRYLSHLSKQMNLSTEKILELYQKTFNIDLIGLDSDLSFTHVTKYLQNNEGFEFIFSETGLDTVRNDLSCTDCKPEDSPIDTLYLSIFQAIGKADPKHVGPPFPGIGTL